MAPLLPAGDDNVLGEPLDEHALDELASFDGLPLADDSPMPTPGPASPAPTAAAAPAAAAPDMPTPLKLPASRIVAASSFSCTRSMLCLLCVVNVATEATAVQRRRLGADLYNDCGFSMEDCMREYWGEWGSSFDWDTDQHAKTCLSATAIQLSTGLDVKPDDYLGHGEQGVMLSFEPSSVCKAPHNRCDDVCPSSHDENPPYNAICDNDCQDCRRDCNSVACVLAFTAICKSTEDYCKGIQKDRGDQCELDVLIFFVCPALLCVCCCLFKKFRKGHIELSESLQLELLADLYIETWAPRDHSQNRRCERGAGVCD